MDTAVGTVTRKKGRPVKEHSSAQGRVKITLPDLTDSKAVEAFMEELKAHHIQINGVKRLLSCCEQILRHQRFIQRYSKAAQLATLVANGIPTPKQAAKHREKHLRAIAERFYTSLNAESLEAQCRLYNLYPDQVMRRMYIARWPNAVITALINAYIKNHSTLDDSENNSCISSNV